MRDLIEQIQATIDSGIYATALISALSIPDAAGAVEFPRDEHNKKLGNGERYRRWYAKYIPSVGGDMFRFDGDTVWNIRNAILHETSSSVTKYGYDKVIFTLPRKDGNVMHLNLITAHDGSVTLNLDLVMFCSDLMRGAQAWLRDIEADSVKQKALDGLIQYRAHGLPMHIVGTPVFA